jgi:GntR family transcriptional regulator/MocR family aminotransferase
MRPRARKTPPLGIAIDPTGSAPLHRQIGEQLRRAILERRLAPGTKLPSSRLMATELDCARGTVLLAIDQLIAEGYLVTQVGSGISVAANLPDEMLVSPGVDGPPAGSAADAPILSRRTIDLLATGLSPQAPFGDPAIAFPLGQPDRDAFPYRLWAKLLEQEWRKPALAGRRCAASLRPSRPARGDCDLPGGGSRLHLRRARHHRHLGPSPEHRDAGAHGAGCRRQGLDRGSRLSRHT